MSARLRTDATGLISDPAEAGTVYGRGYFGTVSEGTLALDRYETVYLSEMARLEVRSESDRLLPWSEVFRRAARAESGFPVRYLVYRDLRQRGYVVRQSPPPARFAVLPRGGVWNKTPARFWVDAISERSPFALGPLAELYDRARSARKTLLLGVVDEESDLTYYRVGAARPQGSRSFLPPPAPFEAFLTEDRVELHDPAGLESLGRAQGFGSRLGSRLTISLVEAAFLTGAGALRLRSAGSGRRVEPPALLRRAARLDGAFAVRARVYRWLRDRGLIVKTGFKYGGHFRAYVRDPEQTHARYLVEAVPWDWSAPWPAVAGHVRLAQGVRKEFLLATVDAAGDVRCFSFERIRP